MRVISAAAALLLCLTSAGVGARAQAALPRLQSSNLIRLGSFNVPAGIRAGGQANAGFEYGGSGISYNAGSNSLFMVGHDWDQFIGEISIPAVGGTAVLLQTLTDATEGQLPSINPGDPNSKKIGGTLRWGNNLIVSAYSYYDGTGTQLLSHFVRPLSLSASGQVTGPLRVGPLGAGMYSGYMAAVPADWRAQFGGPALTGNSSLAIVSRTSYGPAVFAFDPSNINAQGALPLVYYPEAHQTLGPWAGASAYWGGTDKVGGVAFPAGTSSVLFFGRHGSTFCYGPGTSNPALAGQPTEVPGEVYCYDPTNSSKGTHGYPYSTRVWAYDANDLVSVRQGRKQPWDVLPYAMWSLSDFAAPSDIAGAAYDAATQRLYLSEKFANGVLPVVHVYSIDAATSGNVPPRPPTNVRIVP